jgi:hypothetical protein
LWAQPCSRTKDPSGAACCEKRKWIDNGINNQLKVNCSFSEQKNSLDEFRTNLLKHYSLYPTKFIKWKIPSKNNNSEINDNIQVPQCQLSFPQNPTQQSWGHNTGTLTKVP